MAGKKRCRNHGGASNNPAPKGNTRAVKHGFYAKALSAEEKNLWERIEVESVDDLLKLGYIQLRRMMLMDADFSRFVEDGAEAGDEPPLTLNSRTEGPMGDFKNYVRLDYSSEKTRLLRTLGNLLKVRDELGGDATRDPAALARKMAESLAAAEAVQAGQPVAAASQGSHETA
jgi:hypothetical protein